MNIQEQQSNDKNKLARNGGIIISLVVFFYTAVSFFVQGGMLTGETFRFAMVILSIMLLIVFFKLKGNQRIYIDLFMVVMGLLTISTLVTTSSVQLYAILYSVAILIMAYGDQRTITLGSIVAVILIIIANIIHLKNGEINAMDFLLQVIFFGIAIVSVIMVCRMQRKHHDQDLAIVEDAASAQLETSKNIIDLAGKLSEKFTEARQVSDDLNESMESTHVSVMEIVEGTKSTAEAIEQQTAQTADISESISVVGQEASTISDISGVVEASVAEGVDLINQLKTQAEQVAKINIETSETTKALNDSIKDVHAITETILGISSQTNLLALNASIEAARAGEAGKGFAVVADEIRSLSESTREATQQIEEIIERLTKDASSAADAMSKSAEYAGRQNELIEATGDKLSTIKEQTEELHNEVIHVNESVKTVINANTAIMDSITNLSATSEEVAASTDTVLSVSDAAMLALDGMNDTLRQINEISNNMEDVARN